MATAPYVSCLQARAKHRCHSSSNLTRSILLSRNHIMQIDVELVSAPESRTIHQSSIIIVGLCPSLYQTKARMPRNQRYQSMVYVWPVHGLLNQLYSCRFDPNITPDQSINNRWCLVLRAHAAQIIISASKDKQMSWSRMHAASQWISIHHPSQNNLVNLSMLFWNEWTIFFMINRKLPGLKLSNLEAWSKWTLHGD
jgi:hypothetical protein